MTEFIISSEQLERIIEAVEHNTGREINRVVIDGVRAREIVRCRDCKYADWDITAWWCTRDKHNPFKIGELRGYGERSQLGGFCAWGERKVVSE